MNRRIATIIAAGAVGAFAFSMPGRALPPGVRDTYNKSDDTVITCGDNTLTFHAPSDLWPPNHKYYTDIHVTYVDDEGDNVTLTSDGTHDQYDGDTEANGSGHTADDIRANDAQATSTPESTQQKPVAKEDGKGSVTTDWEARSERAGTLKDGRTYTLHAIGTSSDGDKCEGSVTMHVPHDMSPKNR